MDPRPLNPAVAIVVYEASIGLDSGAAQNVFAPDQRQIDRGALTRVDAGNLLVGQSLTLPDGSEIRFEGDKQWAALQLSHDAGRLIVLVAAVVMLLGLLCSLVVRRRRVWLRCQPAVGPAAGDPSADGDVPSRTVVDVGGLARADSGGQAPGSFGSEFAALVQQFSDKGAGKD